MGPETRRVGERKRYYLRRMGGNEDAVVKTEPCHAVMNPAPFTCF